MRFLERKKRMDYLLEMIEKGRCMSLDQVASNFKCSKRTVKRFISDLREECHVIAYSKQSKRFFLKK